ncbi:MAG: RNA polymerase sigma factor [Acidobacteria bacterium]|nr:RNA polymerase sigma factor [Acidobacteriota bacterium]
MEATKSESLGEAVTTGSGEVESPEVTALVERAKAGEADAFADLMRLYEHRIIALGIQMGLTREDAQDTCQDAFTKVFRYIGRFRSGQSFFRWLYRIAVHAVYDHLRKNRRLMTISIDDLSETGSSSLEDAGVSVHRQIESEDMVRKILAGIDTLTRRERIVFVLRDLQQLPSLEIGKILRLSQITVRRHCMTARKKLRERIFPTEH